MGKMKYIIRLYEAHDIDLISFMQTHDINIVGAAYSVLSAFSKGEIFSIIIPPYKEPDVPVKKRKIYIRTLFLDEEKDKGVIEILSMVSKGYRNNFIKNLLRLYLCCPLSEASLENPEDMKKMASLFSMFRDGKKAMAVGKKKTIRKATHIVRHGISKKTSPNPDAELPSMIPPPEPDLPADDSPEAAEDDNITDLFGKLFS